MASVFEKVEVGPQIEVFQLNKSYLEDKFPQKVNLGVGGKFILILFIICFIHFKYISVAKMLGIFLGQAVSTFLYCIVWVM